MQPQAISPDRRALRPLLVLLLVYLAASLLHFVHNAEFLGDYPNMPGWISRTDVYAAWIAMTALGILGWLAVSRGFQIVGLCLVVAYAGCGLDSLGHYVLAPLSAHTAMMNATILLEVTAAALVLVEAFRLTLARFSATRRAASRTRV